MRPSCPQAGIPPPREERNPYRDARGYPASLSTVPRARLLGAGRVGRCGSRGGDLGRADLSGDCLVSSKAGARAADAREDEAFEPGYPQPLTDRRRVERQAQGAAGAVLVHVIELLPP